MSDHTPPAQSPNLLDSFLIRRLHSLSGIIPVGVFMIMHLFTNATMIIPDNTFQHEIDFIHSLPALLFIEIALWSSIGFHAAIGVYYVVSGNRNNARHYGYLANIRYTLQRLTAWPTLIFIFLHIATLRWCWTFGGLLETPFALEHVFNGETVKLAKATTANALQGHPFVLLIYVLGVFSAVYHFANGLWTAAITWGATVTVAAQKRWGFICLLLGITLAFFSITGISAALTYQISETEAGAIKDIIENGLVKPTH